MMETYSDGDIEDEREERLFPSDEEDEAALQDEEDDVGKYLSPDPAETYPDWGDGGPVEERWDARDEPWDWGPPGLIPKPYIPPPMLSTSKGSLPPGNEHQASASPLAEWGEAQASEFEPSEGASPECDNPNCIMHKEEEE